MDKKIGLYTFIGRNSEKYAEFLHWHCEKLKSNNISINYKCILSIGAERIPLGWKCIDKIVKDEGHNSLNHAIAMRLAYEKITEENIVFIDADTCILYKDWDLYILNMLSKFDVFGTAFPDNAKQYTKFPNVFMFCFQGRLFKELKINFDFSPLLTLGIESPVKLQVKTKLQSEAWHKNIGEYIKCDTGYMLPMIVNINNLLFDYIPMANERLLPYRNEEQVKKCAEKPTHMAEWHVNNNLFITHKQASRNHPIDGEWGAIWKDRIGLYTLKEFDIIYE